MEKDRADRRSGITRRRFLGAAASATALTIVPRRVLGGPGESAPSEKLNVAAIGVGKKGIDDVRMAAHHNIVALCDVDSEWAAPTFKLFPKAKRYSDYRVMFERERKSIDAVIIATPDHHHVPAAIMAMRRGKHVYCEKPFGQNIAEIRQATRVAREMKVATQLGNMAHSGHNYRRVEKMVKEGVIGEVREAHCWCDKAWGNHDRPRNRPPVPPHLKWDLWLGPAPVRPYHPCYHPGSWRNWWDFGSGRLGDMGCHMIDMPFMALDLKYPLTVEAESGHPPHKESTPVWLISKWTFPARGKMPPVTLTWYDGDKRPALQKQHDMPDWPEASLLVGSKGMIIVDYSRHKLFPEERFPRRKLHSFGRTLNHMDQWLAACRDGRKTGTNFDYAGPLTETVLLGTVAFRTGEKLTWDAENLRVMNCPRANRLLRRENRKGWEV
ncbi:MAG: Gfo/Idh/MocA family protein [Planctomycetota bacterium]|jgi:predicted dehydrogenase